MSVRFAPAPGARRRQIRRSLSAIGLGVALFLGSALAMRVRQNAWLFLLGAAGALSIVAGVRRLLVGARPLVVGERHAFFGTRGVPLQAVEAVSVEDGLLVVEAGGRRRVLELADPAIAAAELDLEQERAAVRHQRPTGLAQHLA